MMGTLRVVLDDLRCAAREIASWSPREKVGLCLLALLALNVAVVALAYSGAFQ